MSLRFLSLHSSLKLRQNDLGYLTLQPLYTQSLPLKESKCTFEYLIYHMHLMKCYLVNFSVPKMSHCTINNNTGGLIITSDHRTCLLTSCIKNRRSYLVKFYQRIFLFQNFLTPNHLYLLKPKQKRSK